MNLGPEWPASGLGWRQKSHRMEALPSFGEPTFPGGYWLGVQEEGESRAFCIGSLHCSPQGASLHLGQPTPFSRSSVDFLSWERFQEQQPPWCLKAQKALQTNPTQWGGWGPSVCPAQRQGCADKA